MTKKIIIALVLTAALTSCSSHPTEAEVAAPSAVKEKPPGASIEAQQVAAEQKADYVAEISFAKKQKVITLAARKAMGKILKEAAAKGQVEEVRVITWADSEYPSVNTKKLSKDQQQLALDRNKEIEKFLKAQNMDFKIKTFSMAERANALKDFIGSAESRIKKSLEVAGIPTTDTSVKFPSKASKSILLVLMK